VRQVRTAQAGSTVIEQPDYCWGKRTLPNAELVENSDGFGPGADVFEGKATFFGKSDTEDEGTGTAAYGTVQTDSSVFGVSRKRARLLSEGLASEDAKHVLHPTDKRTAPIVEVFFPATGRCGACIPRLNYLTSRTGLRPQCCRDEMRIDSKPIPPGSFVAAAVNLAMVNTAQRYRELVAHFPTERAGLCRAKVMGV
jgi:hypothetical protein